MAGENAPLPKFAQGFLGPQPKFHKYGLEAISHSDPIIRMTRDQSEVEIILGVPPKTRITYKFFVYGAPKDCTDYVLVRALGPNYLFLIRPPAAAFYKFQIFALPPEEAGPQMIGVYNYCVHCSGDHNNIPFPKQYPLWKNGCYLYEPISLPKGTRGLVHYKVLIPGANDVQVKVGEEWNPLQQVDRGIFEGMVNFCSYSSGAKAKVNAQYDGPNHNTLLEYSL